MKNFSKNIIYISFASIFFLCISFIGKAEANTPPPYYCSDGGVVSSSVDIFPTGPFPASSSTQFDVIGYLSSTCTAREVKLTAQNDIGTVYDIIQQQMIPQFGSIGPIVDSVNFFSPTNQGTHSVNFVIGVDDQDPTSNGPIGSVFATGPHAHGSTYIKKVVYVGQAIHPQLTVRVKRYGSTSPYVNTSNPNPPANEDEIYIIPQGYASTTIPQIVSCSSNCGIPLNGSNYATAVSVSGANVDIIIPQQINGQTLHVCKYPDAPGDGMYFSPVFWTGNSLDLTSTCTDRYPDAEVIR